MDFESLKSTISGLSLYDVKASVRKVQNAVMNFTEMEAKVREATNNEPWGASSTIMQEIANGTFNYQQLNEIMPLIYKRFTEKSAEEWRQIYKALQLLEFLIKNGSERVIDDARSHMSLLKMLRQFHFIDQNGKDQGVNVRNRAKELAELLSDVDKIRAERKKARATRNKYGGYEGGGGLGGPSSSGNSRYGGFGSESGSGGGGYGQYSGGVYGDGGGFGGQEPDAEFSGTQSRRDQFEEYDEYDEGDAAPAGRRKTETPASPRVKRETATKAAPPPKAKAPEVDLFSFDDPIPAPAAASSNGKAPASTGFDALQSSSAADDDEFDDFQSAAPAPAASSSAFSIPAPASTSTLTPSTQFAAPQPRPTAAQTAGFSNIFNTVSPPPMSSGISAAPMQPQQQQQQQQAFRAPAQPANYQAAQPNYYQSVPLAATSGTQQASTPASLASLGKPATPSGGGIGGKIGGGGIGGSAGGGAKAGGGADPFANLLGGAGAKKSNVAAAGMGGSMADMRKQNSSLWGAGSPGMGSPAAGQQQQQQQQQKLGGGLDDLLG